MTGIHHAVGAGSDTCSRERSPETGLDLIAFGLQGGKRAAGLMLQPVPGHPGRFRIEIVAGDGAALLSVGPYDEDEVVALWRGLAQSSGLPILLDRPDGTVTVPCRQLGRVRLGTTSERRRLVVLTGRRPRFLVRRKPGPTLRRPLIFREREIAAGRGA